MRSLYPILLLGLFLLESFGQTPQAVSPQHPRPEEVGEGDIVRVDTTLVGVPVTVVDREGRFVAGLKREDFHVYEDGAEQQIAYFAAVESNVTVLLLFDKFVAGNFIKNYREIARVFTEHLGAGDKVLVARFGDSKYEILTKAGEGRGDERKKKHEVKWRFGRARAIHEAIDAAIRRMNTIAGRKAIVLFSDGRFRVDSITITEASGKLISMSVQQAEELATAAGTVDEAGKSDAPFYVMQYDTMTDTVRQGPNPKHSEALNALIVLSRNEYRIADQYLHALTEKSGGRLYPVRPSPSARQTDSSPDIAQAFTQISAELRQQYSLGYYPKPGPKAKERHQIDVRLPGLDVTVRSRTSYTPVPSKP